MWSGGRRELRWTASLLPFVVFADMRRPWFYKMFVCVVSISGYVVRERRCLEHKAAKIGRQSERWRWDVEDAIWAREHALRPHDIVSTAL